jgi:hypothetical protein
LKDKKFSIGFWLGIIVVVGILFFAVPAAIADQAGPFDTDVPALGKQEASRTVALELIAVGIEEYKQALFEASFESLTKAQGSKKYLTDSEKGRLSKYLKAAKEALSKRKEATDHIRSADRLIREGQLIRAKAHLKAVESSGFLTTKEKDVVKNGLVRIKGWQAEQEQQIRQIYDRSVELFSEGQYENARTGFIKVAQSGLLELPEGKTAEDYVHKIDASLGKTESSFSPADLAIYESASTAKSGSWTDNGGILNQKAVTKKKSLIEIKSAEFAQIAAVNKKKTVAQGYTQAIVKDAMTKGKEYLQKNNFYQAQKAVDNAREVLGENRLYLDAGDYNNSMAILKKLEDEIAAGRKKWLGPLSDDILLKPQ